MSVNIKDILNLEVKREQQIISGLNDLQLDDLSKQEIRERTYNTYKAVQHEIELDNA
ncbi:hypothetical protein OAW22_00335 [Pseudomonadales bacterium]|jgi:hypothetical protein|nr:hypothetical protein [Pseudomonadales bacterium]